MPFSWKAAAVAAGMLAIGSNALAQQEQACSIRITRQNLVTCATRANLAVKGEESTRAVLQGRKLAASPLLPSNPVLSLTGARRGATGTEASVLNWSATLAQELEVAGQRASRVRSAQAELDAQDKRVLLSKREAALLALRAYYDTIGAQESQLLATRLLRTVQRAAEVTRGKASQGLVASIDADVMDAALLRALRGKLAADRAVVQSTALLAAALGLDPMITPPRVEGELAPLAEITDATEVPDARRPEVQVFESEQQALLARAESFRRSRVPNPTFSVFAQNDGYDERVLGVGLSLPITLPSPVGRSYAGEIAESEALARRAQVDAARVKREIRLGIANARASYLSHEQAVNALSPATIERAEVSLRDLSAEIEAGRLTAREALLAQQTLTELLESWIAERRALCLASVELARALGVAVEGGVR